MYKHCDIVDCFLSLHDCYAEKMKYENGFCHLTFQMVFGLQTSIRKMNQMTL